MTTTRIYLVKPKSADGKSPRRLVRATHPSHALRHVAEAEYSVAVATHDDLEALLSDGAKVERISGEQQELPA